MYLLVTSLRKTFRINICKDNAYDDCNSNYKPVLQIRDLVICAVDNVLKKKTSFSRGKRLSIEGCVVWLCSV
jgi:hypothetical protein